jgi:hypothetical protein
LKELDDYNNLHYRLREIENSFAPFDPNVQVRGGNKEENEPFNPANMVKITGIAVDIT